MIQPVAATLVCHKLPVLPQLEHQIPSFPNTASARGRKPLRHCQKICFPLQMARKQGGVQSRLRQIPLPEQYRRPDEVSGGTAPYEPSSSLATVTMQERGLCQTPVSGTSHQPWTRMHQGSRSLWRKPDWI